MDLNNNEIIAWKLSERNDLKLVTDTVKKLKCGPFLLHSGQGFQYTTQSYAKLLEEKKLTGSHCQRGNCYDNACIEWFFSHLKTESCIWRNLRIWSKQGAKLRSIFYFTTGNFSKTNWATSPRLNSEKKSPLNKTSFFYYLLEWVMTKHLHDPTANKPHCL